MRKKQAHVAVGLACFWLMMSVDATALQCLKDFYLNAKAVTVLYVSYSLDIGNPPFLNIRVGATKSQVTSRKLTYSNRCLPRLVLAWRARTSRRLWPELERCPLLSGFAAPDVPISLPYWRFPLMRRTNYIHHALINFSYSTSCWSRIRASFGDSAAPDASSLLACPNFVVCRLRRCTHGKGALDV